MTSFLRNFDCVRHSKMFGVYEVYVTKTYSLTENLPCDFGMQYTRDTIHYPNANFSTELQSHRTQRSKGFRDVLIFTIYGANSTLSAHKQSFGFMAGVVML